MPRTGRWKVTGAAGTGVSSFVIDTVIQKLEDGADPSGILVVTASKEAGARLRQEISLRLDDYAAKSSMVRSVHSLAFALLRSDTSEEASEGGIRLITGAEQDHVIRELLVGHKETGGGSWPDNVRPALDFVGFARQLRDFLLRAIERGKGPSDLIEAGREYQRPMWVAAGDFLREYEQTMELAGVHSYSAAELVFQVLLRPHLTAKHPWHTIVVDDAQLMDPISGELLKELAKTADLSVVAGDPDQAVFGFRGASTKFFNTFEADGTIHLTRQHRSTVPAEVKLPGNESAERNLVADAVRRRHLIDGVQWRDIAVVVRSVGDIGRMSRTLLAAGVPVHINPTDVVLSEQRLVAAMLLGLRALEDELKNNELEDLITGPIGGADPVTLRRLIRGLRRAVPNERGIDTLRTIITGNATDELKESVAQLLTDSEARALNHLYEVLAAGREALRAGGSVEQISWAVWSATGLDTRLQSAALRGGATGSQADRDLDAMMALFDAAGDFTERRPNGTLATFIAHIEEQELPTGVRDRRVAAPQAVPVVTAHSAVGQEWDTVIVAGVQEGTWPSFGETGSLFGQAELVDLIDNGIIPGTPVSHVQDRLAEEKRLFHVATTRHRERLVVVTVDAADGDEVLEPSRFIQELEAQRRREVAEETTAETENAPEDEALAADSAAPPADPLQVPVLSVPGFVSQLRRVVCAPEETEVTRTQATRQLARLADAGVPGAHPDEWWAACDVASDVPRVDRKTKREPTLSPSKIEKFLNCPLQATLTALIEDEKPTVALTKGNLAHAFLEALGRAQLRGEDLNVEAAKNVVRDAFARSIEVPAWRMQYEMDDFNVLIDRIAQWHAHNPDELLGTEVKALVRITADTGEATVRGSIDRLHRVPRTAQADSTAPAAGESALRVVDLKTGKNPPSTADAQEHPQLSAYQLVLRHGRLRQDADGTPRVDTAPSGGEEVEDAFLYYPMKDTGSSSANPTRQQAALTSEQLSEFANLLPPLVEEMAGATVTARENPGCPGCPVRHLCPIQPEGRLTTTND